MVQEKVSLIAITPKAEEVMAYCARVSNPNNPTMSSHWIRGEALF